MRGRKIAPLLLAELIDHTLLRPDATAADVDRLCDEAKAYGFAAVCINPVWVAFCTQRLDRSSVRVCSVVGFPLGASKISVKVVEAEQALADGASEIDAVINVGWLKAGQHARNRQELKALVSAVHAKKGALLKIILENCLLTDDEIELGCRFCEETGVDFVKTSTGFGRSGARVRDVALMRRTLSAHVGIKAAGGIRSLEAAEALLKAGATRLGMSASVRVIEELRSQAPV